MATLKRWRLKSRRASLAVAALLIVAAHSFFTAYALHLFGSQAPSCSARPTGAPSTAIFTIVMANAGVNVGFNGSKYHPAPWPVMNVTLGQNVIIHVVNNDTVEAHGFQVIHYFDTGILGGLAPGKCYDVKFTANLAGSFLMQCNVGCSIHNFMQNGKLNVNK
jgi:FtsP/CotA-like multicopper oxidase with cupredoxin domain